MPETPHIALNVGEVAGGTLSDPQNVVLYWPVILEAMQERGVGSRLSQIGMAATIGVETGHTFKPLREIRANPKRQPQLYAGQERYWPSGYYGRGFIQRTWLKNYEAVRRRHFERFGVDVVAEPDQLLDGEIAAWDAAYYWEDNHLAPACEARDWRRARKLVNGGTNGLEDFLKMVAALGG